MSEAAGVGSASVGERVKERDEWLTVCGGAPLTARGGTNLNAAVDHPKHEDRL